MHLIKFNAHWMIFNVLLALVPVPSGWLMYLSKNYFAKIIYGGIWLVFMPNSIYLYTDLINLTSQWVRVGAFVRAIFILQYGVITVLGFVTYILSMYPFELMLKKVRKVNGRIKPWMLVVLVNIIIGFGITLGRVERINSWDILFAPQNVVYSSLRILYSSKEILLTALFGIFANVIYFVLKRPILKMFNTYLSRAGV